MDWDKALDEPLSIEQYELLKNLGVIDLVNDMQRHNREQEKLVEQAYEIGRKESVNELVDFVIKCLSDEFIPRDIVFILNQGVLFNRINAIAFRNLKKTESDLDVPSLKPYENFFRKYDGTTSFLIFESEILDEELIEPLRKYSPEIIVPVNGISGLYGFVLIGRKILEAEYTAREIAYINWLLRFTAVGIQNNIHYEHSVKDSKTGLYNHNFFIKRVSEEIARVKRSEESFSLMILDIDHFKKFNDSYGHLAGDEVILALSSLLEDCMREEDILSRFGGEEFMVLLPGTDREAAVLAAERVRRKIEDMEVDWNDFTLKVTASFGVATYQDNYNDAQDIIEGADAALYEAKSGGRNRCCFDDRSGPVQELENV